MPIRRKRDLSPAQGWLLGLMGFLNFGSVHHLRIVEGNPVKDPDIRVIRELRLPGDNAPRSEGDLDDFELREPVVLFFEELSRIGTGTIDLIEIRHGVPFRVYVEVNAETCQPTR